MHYCIIFEEWKFTDALRNRCGCDVASVEVEAAADLLKNEIEKSIKEENQGGDSLSEESEFSKTHKWGSRTVDLDFSVILKLDVAES